MGTGQQRHRCVPSRGQGPPPGCQAGLRKPSRTGSSRRAGPRAQSSGRVFIEFGTGTSFCWMFAYNSINSTFTRFYCFWFAWDFRIGGPSAFAGAGYSLPKIWKDAATCELHASPRESECSGRNAAVPVVQSRPFR